MDGRFLGVSRPARSGGRPGARGRALAGLRGWAPGEDGLGPFDVCVADLALGAGARARVGVVEPDRDAAVGGGGERAVYAPRAVDLADQTNGDRLTDRTGVVIGATQAPFETRARHFERVTTGHRVVVIELT